MRILYGVVGEGMGHAMRSRVVLDELTKRHEVQVVVSGRAYDYLKTRASEKLAVEKIWGYSIVYEDNEVQNFKTLLENVKGAVRGWPRNVRAYFDLAEKFQPDVVISDFESWSYLFAKNHRLPVISVDNMQIIDRCRHAPEILKGLGAELPADEGDREDEGGARFSLLHHDLLLSARAQDEDLAAPAHPAPRDPGARGPSPANTCSSTRPPPRTRRCPRSWSDPASRAACTVCGAISKRTSARAASFTGRSARVASSTIFAPRAASSRAPASR